jgi:hypothetical protein
VALMTLLLLKCVTSPGDGVRVSTADRRCAIAEVGDNWSSCQRTSRSRSAGRLGLETLAESSLSGKARRNTGISGREPGSTSGSRHGVGDLFTALRRQGLIAEELVLQLATFLRSLDLFFELIVLAPRTLTANQVRHGGKQGTDNPELSRIHSSTCPALTSLLRSFRPKD